MPLNARGKNTLRFREHQLCSVAGPWRGGHGPLIGLRRAFVSCSDSFLPSSRMMRGGRERMELFAG